MKFLSLAQEPVSRQIQDQDNHHCYLILLHLQRNQGLQNHHHLRQNHDHRYREQILFQNQNPLYDLHLIHHQSGSHLRLHPRILPHRHTRNHPHLRILRRHHTRNHLHPRIPRRRHTRNHLHLRIPRRHHTRNHLHLRILRRRHTRNHLHPRIPRRRHTRNHLHPRIPRRRHTRNRLHPRIPRRHHTRNHPHPRIQLLHRKPHPIHHLLRSQRFLQNHFLPDLLRQCLKLLWMNLPGFQSLHLLHHQRNLQHLHR